MENYSPTGSQGAHSLSDVQPVLRFFKLFFVAWGFQLYRFGCACRNFFKYYPWYPRFCIADLLVVGQYFFKSPYLMIEQHDEEDPKDPLGPYGETDLSACDAMLSAFGIGPDASIADLGAGRGRLALFLRLVKGYRRVVACERYPLFVLRAQRAKRWLGIKDLEFHCGDWHEADLRGIDVVYWYNLSFDRRSVEALAKLPKETRIITIDSELLKELPGAFILEQSVPLRFPWGWTNAYLQRPNK